MDLTVVAAVLAAVVGGGATNLYHARANKRSLEASTHQAGASAASELATAAERLIEPLNRQIERLDTAVQKCTDDREALTRQVAELTGQVEVLRGQQAQLTTAGATDSMLAALLRAAPDGLMLVNKWGAIEFASAAAERMFGYGEGALAGVPVNDLVPERFRGQHTANRESFMANPSARPMGVNLDLWGRRRDGSEFPVEIGLSPAQRVGEDVKVAVAIHIKADRSVQS